MFSKNISHLIFFLFTLIGLFAAFNSECTDKDDYSGIFGECDKFLRCSNGIYFLFTCAPGTLFDYKRKICDYPQNVECLGGMQSTKTTSTFLTSLTTKYICSQEIDDFSGFPGDCTKYYRCISGVLEVRSCEAGTQFDYIARRCVSLGQATCLQGSSTTLFTSTTTSIKNSCTQADDYTGVVGDCSKFLRCSNGIFYEFTCAPGTLFDYKRKICDYPHKVTCLSTPTQSTTKKPCVNLCTDEQDLSGINGKCKAYYRCISGSLIEFFCEPGYNFDFTKKKCVIEKEAICLNITTTQNKIFCTDADDYTGVVGDCSKFLRCSNGIFYEFTCAPGTLFDYIRKICDYPQYVTCLQGMTSKSSTEYPLTTLKPCTESDDFSGVPGECNKFYRCISGSLLIDTCEFGLNFDYMTKKCLKPSDAYCLPALSTTTVSSSIDLDYCNHKCTSFDDFTAVYNDCSKFLRCSNGVYYEFTCAAGTLFDYTRRICDFPNKVTCMPTSMAITSFKDQNLFKIVFFLNLYHFFK